jgi:hypothetical protein
MGNTTSTEQSDIGNLATEIDEIAVQYILNQNTIDLLRLTDKEYYDNLIILTSSVVEKKLNHLELGFLNQRIFGKSTISDVVDMAPANSKIKEKIIFNISKFYIKIFMIYSAIATTIDPQYSYEDENGSKKLFYLKDMDAYKHIPKNVKPTLVQLTNPLNLCRKRLEILKNKLDYNVEDSYIKINPGEKLCSLSTTNLLTDEVGIKELDALYYDIFDYDTKTWSKRSKKMKIKYNKDLILFYQIFTGKKVKPAEIKSFHDIELLDMSTIEQCNDVRFMQDILVHNKNALIVDYLNKIEMIETATTKYKSKLISILKELFVIKITNDESTHTINPDLTLDHILLLETETRDTILNLYTSCEKYFIQALIIFEKIYDEQVKVLNVERLNYIDNIKTPPPDVIEQTPEPVFMPAPLPVQVNTEQFTAPVMTPEPPMTPEFPVSTPEQFTASPMSFEQPVTMPVMTPEPPVNTPQQFSASPEPPVNTPQQFSAPPSMNLETPVSTPQQFSVSPELPVSTPEQFSAPPSMNLEPPASTPEPLNMSTITPVSTLPVSTPQAITPEPPVSTPPTMTPSVITPETPAMTPETPVITPPTMTPSVITPPAMTPETPVITPPVSTPQPITPPVSTPPTITPELPVSTPPVTPPIAKPETGTIIGNLFKQTPKIQTNTNKPTNAQLPIATVQTAQPPIATTLPITPVQTAQPPITPEPEKPKGLFGIF